MKHRLIIAISFIMTGIVINILLESNTITHKFIAILGLIMYYRGVFREYKILKTIQIFKFYIKSCKEMVIYIRNRIGTLGISK